MINKLTSEIYKLLAIAWSILGMILLTGIKSSWGDPIVLILIFVISINFSVLSMLGEK